MTRVSEAKAHLIRDTWKAVLREAGLEDDWPSMDPLERNMEGHTLRKRGFPTQADLAAVFGVSTCTISHILNGITHTGAPRIAHTGIRHGPERRAAVLHALATESGTITEICARHGVSRQTVWAWRKQEEHDERTAHDQPRRRRPLPGRALGGGAYGERGVRPA